MDAHSPPQDTRSENLHPRAPDTSLHYDTHLGHTCPADGQTRIGHLGTKQHFRVSTFVKQQYNLNLAQQVDHSYFTSEIALTDLANSQQKLFSIRLNFP